MVNFNRKNIFIVIGILVVVALVLYFKPWNKLWEPSYVCDLSYELECVKSKLKVQNAEESTIAVAIKNMKNEIAMAGNFRVTADVPNVQCSSVSIDDSSVGPDVSFYALESGKEYRLTVDCDGGSKLSKGSKVKFTIQYDYYKASETGTSKRTINGEIFAKVK